MQGDYDEKRIIELKLMRKLNCFCLFSDHLSVVKREQNFHLRTHSTDTQTILPYYTTKAPEPQNALRRHQEFKRLLLNDKYKGK